MSTQLHLNNIQDMLLQFTVERELLESKLNVLDDTDWDLLNDMERVDNMITELKRVYNDTEASGYLSGYDWQLISGE